MEYGIRAEEREWQSILTAKGSDPCLVSDGEAIWIAYLGWGDDGLEWRTNDESHCDLTPTHWRALPSPPTGREG